MADLYGRGILGDRWMVTCLSKASRTSVKSHPADDIRQTQSPLHTCGSDSLIWNLGFRWVACRPAAMRTRHDILGRYEIRLAGSAQRVSHQILIVYLSRVSWHGGYAIHRIPTPDADGPSVSCGRVLPPPPLFHTGGWMGIGKRLGRTRQLSSAGRIQSRGWLLSRLGWPAEATFP
jgi:hypothetical protein